MRTWLAPLATIAMLSLSACGPVTATVIGDGVAPDTDVDTDSDSDTDVDTDSDTDPDTDPPIPAYTEWRGSRAIDFGRCEGVLEESGSITDDREAAGACPECDAIYRIDVEPGQICGVAVRSPAWRGVILGRRAEVVNLVPTDRGWEAELLAEGSYERADDVIVIEYAYEGQVGQTDFEVFGRAELLRDE